MIKRLLDYWCKGLGSRLTNKASQVMMSSSSSARFLLSLTFLGLLSIPNRLDAKNGDFAPISTNVLGTPNMLAQTGQPRSDRVVGLWRSSSGADLTLAYTGRPTSLWIQVYPSPGRAQPRLDYTATWINDTQFSYVDSKGSKIIGRIDPTNRKIMVRGDDGWFAEWSRQP